MMATFIDYGAHLPRLQIDQELPALVVGFAPMVAIQRGRAGSPNRTSDRGLL
jgi:hypothetical protein